MLVAPFRYLKVCLFCGAWALLVSCTNTDPKRLNAESDCLMCADALQVGLYHVHADGRQNTRAFFSSIRDAGFGFVHLWEGQAVEPVLEGLRKAGLQAVVHYPNDDLVFAYRNDPVVLGWYLDEEPSHILSIADSRQALESFHRRRQRIKGIDPNHPVFALDGPHTEKVDEIWRDWAVVGDISAHFNYPVTVRKLRDTSPPQRVAETVSLARALNPQSKPVWFVVQAFGGEERGWRMPTPQEYRAMVYSAVMHGASGIIVFAYDSFVMRDDGIVGVRPDPKALYPHDIDYNNDGKPPHVASAAELEASRQLWTAVVSVNRELNALGPWLLSPTDVELDVRTETLHGPGHDVTYMVKNKHGQRMLIILNSAQAAVKLWVTVPGSEMSLTHFFDTEVAVTHVENTPGFMVELEPYSVTALKLEQSKGGAP